MVLFLSRRLRDQQTLGYHIEIESDPAILRDRDMQDMAQIIRREKLFQKIFYEQY